MAERSENGAEMLARLGTDAEAWAAEFAKVFRAVEADPLDPTPGDLLHTWFCNLIGAGEMAGYSQAKRERNPNWPLGAEWSGLVEATYKALLKDAKTRWDTGEMLPASLTEQQARVAVAVVLGWLEGGQRVVEAAAKALWDDEERRWQAIHSEEDKPPLVPWENMHELDRAEFIEKARAALRAACAAAREGER